MDEPNVNVRRHESKPGWFVVEIEGEWFASSLHPRGDNLYLTLAPRGGPDDARDTAR
ncbi:hypothetical protein FHX37_0616 [Haloactinospora alba]|uniref:Uncharacterized protein n=1 Tax=Haloactinospora alba TaxID=405555 RepID=A0A543NG10_9ACTN|nr:hypothetical protein [Haloactinospora alba]TQN30734.1 hypothetical protein FHX37_0616 [Haloactinospora alba]